MFTTIAALTIAIATALPGDEASAARDMETHKDWAGAAQVWEKLQAANPTQARFPLNAANDWYSSKEYAKAIPEYQVADALGVSYKWDMPYSIACCYALLDKREDALKWLGISIRLGYRDLNQVRTDKDLESLHSDPRFQELAASADISKMDRIHGYRYDLWLLNRELRRLHYSPYGRYSKAEFDSFVKKLDNDIPNLDDVQIAARLKQLAAMAADGHTHITTPAELPDAKLGLPVSFMSFQEGMFVIGADPEHTSLLGRQVTAIGGRPIDQILESVKPICSYENPMWIVAREPTFLRVPALLKGLDLIADPNQETLTLKDGTNKTQDVTLKASSGGPDKDWKFARHLSTEPTPLTFVHRDKNYWFELLPDSKTVFFQYNAVADMPDESIEKFSDRLFKFIDEHNAERLILDMRWNGGGNNFLNKPLLEGLIKSKLNKPGKLFVIIGRNTFSAAMCFATQVERYTNAIFAGEPTGSSPNFIGESIPIDLPYSKMHGTVSDLYWQNSTAMDHRIWIAPKIYLPPRFADYATNHDPVIDAILAYP